MSLSLILLSLFASSNALAWDVPLHLASYNPGPHSPGPIDCAYTNADGQEFSGTVTSDGNGGLLCSGIAEPTQEAVITALMTEQGLTAADTCAAVVEGTDGYIDNVELLRTDDLVLDGQALQIYCDDPDYVAPGEVVVTEAVQDATDAVALDSATDGVTVEISTDVPDEEGVEHEIVVTYETTLADGTHVEEEIAYGKLAASNGRLKGSFRAPAHLDRFDVVVRPVDAAGFALSVPGFQASEGGFATRVRNLEGQLDADGFHVQRGESELSLRLDTWGRLGMMNVAERLAPALGDCGDAHPAMPGGDCVSRVEYRREGITEFWQTLPTGFEQGWTLETRPPGEGDLLLEVAIADALDWVVDADGLGARIRSSQGAVFRYEGLAVWGADGAPVQATMTPTDTGLLIAVHCDDDATYPLTIDPLIKTIAATKSKSGNYK